MTALQIAQAWSTSSPSWVQVHVFCYCNNEGSKQDIPSLPNPIISTIGGTANVALLKAMITEVLQSQDGVPDHPKLCLEEAFEQVVYCYPDQLNELVAYEAVNARKNSKRLAWEAHSQRIVPEGVLQLYGLAVPKIEVIFKKEFVNGWLRGRVLLPYRSLLSNPVNDEVVPCVRS